MSVALEKRSFTRITLDIPVSIYLYQTQGHYIGTITNISCSGLFFPVKDKLPVGEKCEVVITVGEGLETKKLTVTGKIIRNDSEGAGINFIDISPECSLLLKKIISDETAKRQWIIHSALNDFASL